MKHLDLFAGLCGFSLAARWMNWQTIGFVENDVVRRAGIKHEFGKNANIVSDIRNVTAKSFSNPNIVTAGFPCQPFSVAGKRLGQDDNRFLWDETLRVTELYRPAWFIGENVDGIFSMALSKSPVKVDSKTIARNSETDYFSAIYTREEDMLIEKICQDLEGIGYQVQPLSIPSFAVNAWDERQRCWLLAYSDNGFSEPGDETLPGRNILAFEDKNDITGKTVVTAGQFAGTLPGRFAESRTVYQNDIADCNSQGKLQPGRKLGKAGRRVGNGDQKNSADTQCVGCEKARFHPQEKQSEECAPNGERIPDWRHEWWQTEQPVFSRNDGIPVELDGCQMSAAAYANSLAEGFGNAVNPKVVYRIFSYIAEVEKIF